MNEVQVNKIKKRADEYATSCFPYEKQFLEREAVVKCCVHVVTETIAELEQENVELKEELKKWKDEWQEQVQKATDEGYARTLQTMQLNKAKELLNEFLDFEASCMERGIYISDKIRAEAEQFIKDSEV